MKCIIEIKPSYQNTNGEEGSMIYNHFIGKVVRHFKGNYYYIENICMDSETKEYTVVQGDTIDSVAFANQLSASELIIANDDIDSTENILAIGQKLNVALIKPILTLIYEELVVEDVEEQYKTEEEKDDTQYTSYKKNKKKGANGINRITSRVQFMNGDTAVSEAHINVVITKIR